MLKANELRDKADDELEAMLIDLRRELFVSVNEAKQTKQSDKPHLAQHKRKSIARILTVLRGRQAQKTSK